MLAGGLACCLSRTLVSPLNVVSQHQTFERLKNPRARVGMGAVAASILRRRGFAGFWRGNAVQCAHGFPEKGLAFLLYESCYRTFSGMDENARCFASGSIAGLVSTVALYPLETISSRICVSYTGNLYRGLFNGLVPSVLSVVPTTGLVFALYHGMKRRLGHADDPVYMMAYSGLASSIACFATWPLYGLRQRMYLCETAAALPALVAGVLRAEGLGGFYVGCASNMVKLVPKAAIQMTAYELMASREPG